MRGYLLKNQKITLGEEIFIDSVSLDNNYEVIFEDDTDTGYFYGAERNKNTNELRILDMLLIYDVEAIIKFERTVTLNIIWSVNWTRCGLILNNYCHAVFDFEKQSGYNRHEFPAPVLWKGHNRKLTDEMVAFFFE